MAFIDPEGLFGGDRLRRCSNAAQLHWPRLFLASDGFARLEINYARIIGRAYPTFSPIPSETELQSFIQEYWKNFLLFLYQADGRTWGQWDTRPEFLPRYKTATDRRSPKPPEPAFTEWKKRYRQQNNAFPKCFGNISETFHAGAYGVGVGVGVEKTICASQNDARVSELPSTDNPPFETTEPDASCQEETPQPKPARVMTMTTQQEAWFNTWWEELWRRRGKKNARGAFAKQIKTEERFQQVMAATRAQKPEMMQREVKHRPYPATWLNSEGWEDEPEHPTASQPHPSQPPGQANGVGYGDMESWKKGIES